MQELLVSQVDQDQQVSLDPQGCGESRAREVKLETLAQWDGRVKVDCQESLGQQGLKDPKEDKEKMVLW